MTNGRAEYGRPDSRPFYDGAQLGKWVSRYTDRRYHVVASSWPGMDDIDALRRDPSVVENLGIQEIVDHYDALIRQLDSPPIIIGHSFAGAFTEILLDRGLGAAGVAIDAAAVRGILKLPGILKLLDIPSSSFCRREFNRCIHGIKSWFNPATDYHWRMRQTSFAEMHCSLAHALEAVGDWWTPLILRDLFMGLDRFDDLATDLGISRNLLTTRLTELVEHGIVERQRYSERPPRDRYVLTQAGRELAPIFAALTAWGDRWATPSGGPPARFLHQVCGQSFTPTVTCPQCGKPVSPEDLGVLPGPGARSAPGTLLYGKFTRDNKRRYALVEQAE